MQNMFSKQTMKECFVWRASKQQNIVFDSFKQKKNKRPVACSREMTSTKFCSYPSAGYFKNKKKQ